MFPMCVYIYNINMLIHIIYAFICIQYILYIVYIHTVYILYVYIQCIYIIYIINALYMQIHIYTDTHITHMYFVNAGQLGAAAKRLKHKSDMIMISFKNSK